MLIFLRNILVIYSLIFTTHAFGSNSSSYLLANKAFSLHDFDTARIQFNLWKQDFSESDLRNQLLTYVNLNLFTEANLVAEKIIKINMSNQEAWVVNLAFGIIEEDFTIFKKFKLIDNKSEMNLVKYIFFSNSGEIRNKKLISRSIFEVIQASVSRNNKINSISYEYLLFYLSIAIVLDPLFYEAYFNMAQIYEILENYPKAESYYNKIPDNQNLFIESQINIATNNSKISFHEENLMILKNLLNKNNQNISIIISLANIYRIEKNYKEAIKYYTNIINLNNNSYKEYWRVFYLRGICYERLKKWNLAEKDFLSSLEINPNSPQVLNYLAYAWLERDLNIDKSIEMLKEAYNSNPKSHYIADSLAWAFFKNNEFKKALLLMEKVIIMAPGEAISLYHLGDIYYAMNRKREASYFWKQAFDLAEPEDEIIENIIKKLKIYNDE